MNGTARQGGASAVCVHTWVSESRARPALCVTGRSQGPCPTAGVASAVRAVNGDLEAIRKREGWPPPSASPATPRPRAALSVCRSPIRAPSSRLSVTHRWPFPEASEGGAARPFCVPARPRPGAGPAQPAPCVPSRLPVPGLVPQHAATSCVGSVSRAPGCRFLEERQEPVSPSIRPRRVCLLTGAIGA